MRQRLSSLYEGLRHYLMGDDLWHALCIWQDHHTQASTFELKEYLNQIGPLLPEGSSRSQVHRKLVKSLLMNGTVATFDPVPTMNEFRVKHGLEVPAMQKELAIPEHVASFVDFYQAIHTGLAPELAERLHGKLVWLAEKYQLTDEFQNHLISIHARYPIQAYITDEPESLAPLMDACYELLCEWVGPVEADIRFNRALLQGKTRNGYPLEALL